MNNANDVSVPYSLSNRSSSGVNAKTFMIMCIKPRCINGYVFVRYTMSVAQCSSVQTQSHRWISSQPRGPPQEDLVQETELLTAA